MPLLPVKTGQMEDQKNRLSTNVSPPNIHIPSLNVVEEELFSLPTADCQLLAAKLGFSYAVNQREGSIMFVLVNHFCDSVVKKLPSPENNKPSSAECFR